MPYKDPEKARESNRRSYDRNKKSISAKRKIQYILAKTKHIEYYIKNKTKISNRKKMRYEQNKDAILKIDKIYRLLNKDNINNRCRAKYKANKQYILAKHKEYHENNRDILNLKRRHNYKSKLGLGALMSFGCWCARAWYGILNRIKRSPRYKKRGIICEMSREEFCAWCEERRYLIEPLLELRKYNRALGPSVDRIDPDGHYSIDNIRILTWSENSARARKPGQLAEAI